MTPPGAAPAPAADPVRHVTGLVDVPPGPSVVTVGFFDGLHRGHRTLVRRAVDGARAREVRAVAVTFDRHPNEVLRPGSQPRYLQTTDRKVAALLDAGIALVVVLPFTHEFSLRSAQAFVDDVLVGALDAVEVIVGANFRFGHGATGDVAYLQEQGGAHGFVTDAVSLLHVADTAISSTEIRDHLARGEVEWATWALGRPHVLDGVVVRGDQRGRTIGVPTANIEVPERMQVPARGVYAGHVETRHGTFPAMTNIGVRPTFGGDRTTIESHLLDVDLDLYGDHVAVTFAHRLRDEQRFDGVDALVAQIHADIARGRELLNG